MKRFRYRIVVEWSDEDEAFVGRVPALPACAAHGRSPEEAAQPAGRVVTAAWSSADCSDWA